MIRTVAAMLVSLSAMPSSLWAGDAHPKPAPTAQAAAALSEGEVRRVDKEGKKLTIRHGPLANLDMPPMTMVFQVKDAGMVEAVKPGDRIRFQADKIGAAYVVTHIELEQSLPAPTAR